MECHVSIERKQGSLLLSETQKDKTNILHKHNFRGKITVTFIKYIQWGKFAILGEKFRNFSDHSIKTQFYSNNTHRSGNMSPLAQWWQVCYGSNQRLSDWFETPLDCREFTSGVVKACSWGGPREAVAVILLNRHNMLINVPSK